AAAMATGLQVPVDALAELRVDRAVEIVAERAQELAALVHRSIPRCVVTRLDGPVGRAASLDRGEVPPLEGLLVFRQDQFPERKECVPDLQSFQAGMGTVE